MFRFEIGEEYKTQDGKMVRVLNRVGDFGYECLECSDNKYRYDRSNSILDNGRVTGSSHDYSHPDNFDRAWAGLPSVDEDMREYKKNINLKGVMV